MKVTQILPVSNSGDLSQATLVAGPCDLRTITASAIQAVWTGAGAAGTLQLQLSLAPPSSTSTDVNSTVFPGPWTNVGNTVTMSGPGNNIWDLPITGASAARIVYTKTGSSTGTLSGFFNAKS